MPVARAYAAKLTDDRAACEIKIAKRVEQLVANEFIIIPQAAGVQDVIAADDDDVVERPAAPEARRPKSVDLVEKAKRARSTDLRLERPGGLKHHAGILAVDQWIVEINRKAHRKAVIRQQCCSCIGLGHGDRFEHLDGPPRCILLDDAGALDQEQEWRRAAV